MARGERRGRARKLLKAVLFALLGALGLVFALVLVAVFALHTDWGRERVLERAERELEPFVRGELQIGTLSGSPLGRFALEDVSIRDREGRVVVAAERVDVEYAPLALLGRRVELGLVALTRPRVSARIDGAGRLNLAELFDFPEPDPDVEPPALDLDRLVIAEGALDFDAPDAEPVYVSGLDVRAAGRFDPPDEGQIELAELTARAALPARGVDMDVSARGSARLRGEAIAAEEIALRAGESSLAIPAIEGAPDGGFRGEVAAEVSAADVAALIQDPEWVGDAELAGPLAREDAGAPIEADLRGALAEAPTRVRATADPDAPSAAVSLEARGFDPSAARADAPPGAIDAELGGSLRGTDLATARGEAELSARGEVAGFRADSLKGRASLAEGTLSAQAQYRLPGARGRAHALLALDGEAPTLTGSALRASITDPDALTQGEVPARGRVDVDASAVGPLDDLAIRATLDGEGLAMDEIGAESLSARLALDGVPRDPTGTARAEAGGVRLGPAAVSRAELEAEILEGGERVTAELSAGAPGEPYGAEARASARIGEGVRADLHQLAIRTRELTWRAEDASASVDARGAVAIQDLELASDAGRIVAEGRARGGDEGDLRAELEGLDLGRAHAAIFPDEPALSGVAHARAEAAWPPAAGEIEGQIAGFESEAPGLAPLPAVDLDVEAEMTQRRVVAAVGARAHDQAAELRLRARAPSRPLEPGAWEALGADAIEELAIELDRLDLAALAEAADAPGPERGRAFFSAEFGPGLREGSARGRAEDFHYGDPFPPGRAELELDVREEEGARLVDVDASARTADDQRARVRLRARPPDEILAPQAWRALDAEEAVAGLDVDIEGARLAPVFAELGEPAIESGRLDFRARLGDRLESGVVRAEVEEIRHEGALPAPARAELRARLNARDVRALARASAAPVGSAEMRAEIELPRERFSAEAIADAGADLLRQTRARGELDLAELGDLAPIPLEGEVRLRARADERLRDARAEIEAAALSAGGLPQPVDAEFEISAEPNETHVELDAWLPGFEGGDRSRRVASASGSVSAGSEALAAGDLEAFLRADATAEALARARLGHIGAALDAEVPLTGVARARVELGGSLADPELAGWLDSPDVALARVRFDALRGFARLEGEELEGRLVAEQRDGRLDARAALPLDEPSAGALSLTAREFDLAFLAAILAPSPAPVLDVGGRLSADLSARPDLGEPELEGFLRVEDGRVNFADLRPIRDGEVEIEHRDGRAEIRATARSDDGTVDLSGEAQLDGLEPTSVTADARVRDFPVPAVPQMPMRLDLDARLDGTLLPTDLWRADVEAERVVISLPETDEHRRELGPVGELDDVVLAGEEDPEEELIPPEERQPLALVRLHTPNDVLIRGEDVTAQIETDLRVTLLQRGATVEGSLAAVRGDLRLFDRQYEIERARASFEGRIPPDPRIDVRLSHQFTATTLFIDATGTAENPSIRFASDPGIYDQAQLLSFVLGGNPDTGAEPGMEPGLEERAVGAAGALIAEQVGDVLRRAFPIDVLRIGAEDPAEGVIGFVTVGTWVRDDLFVAYRRRADPDERENIHEAMLEYQIYRNWTLEGVAGPDRGSVDLLWIQRY